MDAKRQECLVRVSVEIRTMQIIIQDDTFSKSIIQWRSLSKCFLPPNNIDGTKDSPNCFTLMVHRRNTIGVVKAYIQEEKQIAFKKQKLFMSVDGEVLSDEETLRSLGIKKGSTLILRYAPITQISMKMLMLCSTVKDPCSLSRTMQIIIHDDTYKDFIDGTTKKCRISYTVMVAPDDTIVAVKAYIQEQIGLSFKNQKLMNEVAVLRDWQTLVSLGIKKGSSLILRYAPISNDKFRSCVINVKVQHGDTVGDVKAILQEKTGFRFHKQILMNGGRILANEERLVDHDKLVL